jgi:hypothetical protein
MTFTTVALEAIVSFVDCRPSTRGLKCPSPVNRARPGQHKLELAAGVLMGTQGKMNTHSASPCRHILPGSPRVVDHKDSGLSCVLATISRGK